ncbi:Protein FAR1-RELATED SEQUENCE 6 [Rhynchospora pubera]|uniref:Protein FAR1-RELATED SEQUENCE 6 n=1 Tax=Rhynchospora pubera TaxID=906938 RepID=A0AAV8GE56_9POAL|nr:Protein FAR1-RELATED SEQUENCE 6 [Rhynchospora pubera]
MDTQLKDVSELLDLKFDTRNELLYAVRRFYAARGCVLSIRSSRPDKNVILRCDKGGSYRNSHQLTEDLRKRKRTSRLIGCPFEVRGRKQEEGFWIVDIKEPKHNHDLDGDAEGECSEVEHGETQPNADVVPAENNVPDDNIALEEITVAEEQQEQQQEHRNNNVVPVNDVNAHFQILHSRFKTRTELLQAVRGSYAARGYILTTRSSRPDKNVILGCYRGGTYRNTHKVPLVERKKSIKSRLIGCPFRLWGIKQNDGFWAVRVKNSTHNHEPANDISAYPLSQRLTRDELETVDELTKSGQTPRQIMLALKKKNPDLKVISKTIYNAKKKIVKDKLAGRSTIEALFDELIKAGFNCNFLKDQEGHLTHLFAAHPLSVVLTKCFSNIFVMDSTRKCSGYKMHMLGIAGISSFNTAFYSCFCFLEKEDKESYVWALKMFSNILGHDRNTQPSAFVSNRESALTDAINVVFPTTANVFGLWHVEKSVKDNCKRYFETKEDWDAFLSHWKKVVSSPTEAEFLQSWDEFESSYSEKGDAIGFIKHDWIPWKEKFISAWSDKCFHFSNQSSSSGEDALEKLKKLLHVSAGDLREVKNNFSTAVEKEYKDTTTRLESEKIRVLYYCCKVSLFENILCRVSEHALVELYKQYEKVKKGEVDPVCTGRFRATMGLPCAHSMVNSEALILDSVHQQWRIDTRLLPRRNPLIGFKRRKEDLCPYVDLNGPKTELSDDT